MALFTGDTFGPDHIGNIYGKQLLAWSLAGVIGPLGTREYFASHLH